jgi:hypothetical protein
MRRFGAVLALILSIIGLAAIAGAAPETATGQGQNPYTVGSRGGELLVGTEAQGTGYPRMTKVTRKFITMLNLTDDGANPGNSAAAQTRKYLWKSRMRSGIYPGLNKLNALSLGVSAFSVGWTIGRGIDTHFLRLSGPGGYFGEPIDVPPVGGYTAKPRRWVRAEANNVYNGPHYEAEWIVNQTGVIGVPFCQSNLGSWPAIRAAVATLPNYRTTTLPGTCSDGSAMIAAYMTEADVFAGLRVNYIGPKYGTYPTGWDDSGDGSPIFGTTAMPSGDTLTFTTTAPGTGPTQWEGLPNSSYPAWCSTVSPYDCADPLDWTEYAATGSAGQAVNEESTDPNDSGPGTPTSPNSPPAQGTTNAGDVIKHHLNPADYPDDPLNPSETFTMPSCIGLTVAQCESLIEDAATAANRPAPEITIGVADLGEFDPLRPPRVVIITVPAEDAEVESGTPIGPITITINPDPMPIQIPEPLPFETYLEYILRLQLLGLVGSATEANWEDGDPELGPDMVLAPSLVPVALGYVWPNNVQLEDPEYLPSPVPQNDPDIPDVEFTYNPTTWPEIGDPESPAFPDPSIPPPTAPPFNDPNYDPAGNCSGYLRATPNWKPLTELNVGSRFPFGVVTYLAGVLSVLLVTPDAPVFEFSFELAAVGNFAGADQLEYRVDLDVLDPYMTVIRTIISVLIWIGGLWYLGSALLGFRAAGDIGDGYEEAFD